jgi:hypothetical protein
MTNVMTNPTNFPRRINMYVPAMQYSSDVNYNAPTRVNFGAPAAANATLVSNAVSISAAGTIDLSSVAPFPETYGRTATIVASGATSVAVLLNGWDYLGQPIQESLTLNGATPVNGKKAFKAFLNLVVGTGAAVTVNIGSGNSLGLPYKALRAAYEVANGVVAAAGTLVAGALTDPQTATTADPRGIYTPTTALNGTNIISAVFDFANDVNTANNGGLHGIRQFAA